MEEVLKMSTQDENKEWIEKQFLVRVYTKAHPAKNLKSDNQSPRKTGFLVDGYYYLPDIMGWFNIYNILIKMI